MFGWLDDVVSSVSNVIDVGWDAVSSVFGAGETVTKVIGGQNPADIGVRIMDAPIVTESWWDNIWNTAGDAVDWVSDFSEDNPWVKDIYNFAGGAFGYGPDAQPSGSNNTRMSWSGGGSSYRGGQGSGGGGRGAMVAPVASGGQHPLRHWTDSLTRRGGSSIAPVRPNLEG